MGNNIQNILIIENTRDNQIVNTVFFKDLSEITNENLREAVKYAIENPDTEKDFQNNVSVCSGVIFLVSVYVFGAMKKELRLPITVENIVNSVF